MPEKKVKDNMELWNKVCKTDPAITKSVKLRGGFTSIDAQAQIKRATEVWGSYGGAWGVRDCKYDFINTLSDAGEQTGIYLIAIFYYPEGEFEIASDMFYQPHNDCMKKLLTDVTTKALSKLGFNSDVFEGKFDDNKYVEEMEKEFGNGKGKDKGKDEDKSKIKLPPNSNLYFIASEIKDMEKGKKTEGEILAETEHRVHLKKNWPYLTPPVLVEIRIIRNNPKLYDWYKCKEDTLDNAIFKGTNDDNRKKIIKDWKKNNKKEQ